MDERIKRMKVGELRTYLRQQGCKGDGEKNLQALKKVELQILALKVEKAKSLNEIENEMCESCKKDIDNCTCSRCGECFEISKNCFCVNEKHRIQKLEKMNQMMGPLKNLFTQFAQSQQDQLTNHLPTPVVTPKSEPTPKKKVKKVRKIKVKKPKRKVVSIPEEALSVSTEETISVKTEPIIKIDEFDLEDELQVTAMKIKIKLFISEKIENKNSVQKDVFHLLHILLKKHKIILQESEKGVFPRIFQRIYKESIHKQKVILKDIITYMINCDTKTFDRF